jgi:hypothetical protein
MKRPSYCTSARIIRARYNLAMWFFSHGYKRVYSAEVVLAISRQWTAHVAGCSECRLTRVKSAQDKWKVYG